MSDSNDLAKPSTHDIFAEAVIKASPEAVWDRLVAFDNYPAWHAPVRLQGEARADGPVTYSLRARFPGVGDRWTRFPGRITEFEPPRELRIEVGFRFLLRIELEFKLEALPKATSIQHTARASGLYSVIGRGRIQKVLATAVPGTLAAMKNRTAQAASGEPARARPNRKTRRAQHAKGK